MAAPSVGMASRNEKSAAAAVLTPPSWAPTIVVIEREEPGQSAMHCARPMPKARLGVTAASPSSPGAPARFRQSSIPIITTPPTINAAATGAGAKRSASIFL